MIEYLLLSLAVLLAGSLAMAFHWNAVWLVIPMILLALPSILALFTGSPYVPTSRKAVERMLELANLRPGEIVIDLGCGDGRVLREASRRGARAIGYELSIFMFLIARLLGGGEVRLQNFWKADCREADVVFLFLEKRFLPRFEREIWPQLKPGCRVAAYTFPLPSIQPSCTDRLQIFIYVKG